MQDKITLEQLWGAFVNQGTLEEAAAWMASLARTHPSLAAEFHEVLNTSIAAAARGDVSVIETVNQSGYRISTAEEAGQYCKELFNAYVELRAGNA